MLAGVSVEYYSRLERGDATGVSESVVEAIARVLRLDEAERVHLLDLLRPPGSTRARHHRPTPEHVRSTVQWVLDSMHGTAALVLNARLDILASNALGLALYAPAYDDPTRPPNTARFVFLDPRAFDFFRQWNKVADDTVAILRAEAGKDPYDRRLSDLVGELSTRSDEFRTRWGAHNVRIHATGAKLIHHPVVGDIDLLFESFPIAGDSRQSLLAYTAEPGSPSQDALNLLASWAATTNSPERPGLREDSDHPEPSTTAD
jgi:transcriptional regulator with XRE-family HTH domain